MPIPEAPICPSCNHSHWPGYPHVWGNAPRKACSECLSKDMRIAELEAEVESLRGGVIVGGDSSGKSFNITKDGGISTKPSRSEAMREVWRKRKEKTAGSGADGPTPPIPAEVCGTAPDPLPPDV